VSLGRVPLSLTYSQALAVDRILRWALRRSNWGQPCNPSEIIGKESTMSALRRASDDIADGLLYNDFAQRSALAFRAALRREEAQERAAEAEAVRREHGVPPTTPTAPEGTAT
jgi:hypothetical protein